MAYERENHVVSQQKMFFFSSKAQRSLLTLANEIGHVENRPLHFLRHIKFKIGIQDVRYACFSGHI